MKYLSFDSYQSLNNKRLIFNENTLIKIFECFHNFILIISPLILGLAFFYIQVNYQNPIIFPISIVTLILSILLTRFIYFQFKKSLNFRKIISKESRKENMELIELICYWNNWKVLKQDNLSHVIKIENSKFAYHSGKELYIIYKDNIIYLRCLTYAMHGLTNPFHWKNQRKIENIIIQKINQ